MKVKPKKIMVNLPIVLMFDDEEGISKFASNINTLIHGKVKVKCETLGMLNNQYVGIFYLQRHDEFSQLREQFVSMIENEEVLNHNRETSIKIADKSIKKFNGGIECDVEIGPCACGAWHTIQYNKKNFLHNDDIKSLLNLLDSILARPEDAGQLIELYRTRTDSKEYSEYLDFLLVASFKDTASLLSVVGDLKEELK